jgi:hypothetical protein
VSALVSTKLLLLAATAAFVVVGVSFRTGWLH